jgi:putative ribosome biogenesis GTPase RsgA
VEKTRKYEDFLKEKKVYILIGQSGAGKSTSIYYWSGQEMVEKIGKVENAEELYSI